MLRPPHEPLLVAYRRAELGESGALSEATWEPLEQALASPDWIPSAHETSLEELGASVRVLAIDPSRYDWTILAGLEERAHRFDGDFPEQLKEPDRDRTRIAIGLATAKRRGPHGLRIDGSTGLAFRGQLAVFGVGSAGVELDDRGTRDPAVYDDATELARVLDEGQLTPAARQRGPRLSKADLCLRADGLLLVAETVFDSHEATARALLRLGCTQGVSLDRGTERASWLEVGRAARGPFDSTALVALDRPMVGAVRASP
jgi:hypothetical protein